MPENALSVDVTPGRLSTPSCNACQPSQPSTAGHAEPGAAGANVSRVAGLGYLGVLAGPAVIGWLTHVVPLNIAFLLPVALCLVAAASANVLRTDSAEEKVSA